MARGQLTMFIIIGLLIAAVVGGAILLSSRVAIERGTAAAERQQVRAELVKPVQQFITNCLDQALVQGLELLGRQGGYLYLSQDGPSPDPVQPGTALEHEGVPVRYLVFPPVGTVGNSYFSTPPDYPWPTFPRVFKPDGSLRYARFFFGYFGRNLLPPLARGSPGSIQDQLESFLNAKMRQCRLDAFEAQGLAVETGEPNASTTFATADTSVILSWEVALRDTATDARTVLEQFTASAPVRLNTTYALVRTLLDREVTEINFTLAGLYGDGFTVDILQDKGGPGEDLVQVRDSRSRLKGQPYLFQFGRHNRPPALFLIPQEVTDFLLQETFCPGTSISLASLPPATAATTLPPGAPRPPAIHQAQVSINSPASTDVPCAGRDTDLNRVITLEALDPDEDNLTFSCAPACPYQLTAEEVDRFVTLYEDRWPLSLELSDTVTGDSQQLQLRVGT
jgi:hypothetical protein